MLYLCIMKKKICRDCSKRKSVNDFYKNKLSNDGLFHSCKDCVSEQKKNMRRTERGVLAKMHDSQKVTSKRRGDPPPSYTLEWLVEWGMAQQLYHNLFKAYKDSGYNKWLKPSVDRIDDYGYYTEDNIQLMTWRENHIKCHDDLKNGNNNKLSKTTYQCFLSGDVYKEHHSVRSAERKTGIDASSICAAIKGDRQRTAGGYIWRH